MPPPLIVNEFEAKTRIEFEKSYIAVSQFRFASVLFPDLFIKIFN
jgi:hypothetical protein